MDTVTEDPLEAEMHPDSGTTKDKDAETLSSKPCEGSVNDETKENLKKYGWITNLRNFLSTHRIDLGMWCCRMATLVLITFTIFPIFGGSYTLARRALICNAITSGLRLYQRVGKPFCITKELCAAIIFEDAFHYLIYSLMFLLLGHVTFCLIPIFLFSSLHAASFSLQVLEVTYGPVAAQRTALGSLFLAWKSKTSTLLRLAASAEVAFMGLIIIHCFRGMVSWITPIAYYRFICMRYLSRRNPHTRTVLYEMRISVEGFLASGKCPVILAKLLRGIINILCKLSPI